MKKWILVLFHLIQEDECVMRVSIVSVLSNEPPGLFTHENVFVLNMSSHGLSISKKPCLEFLTIRYILNTLKRCEV